LSPTTSSITATASSVTAAAEDLEAVAAATDGQTVVIEEVVADMGYQCAVKGRQRSR